MSRTIITVTEIDALLPQTQCGLCSYGGCKPYAEAILYQNEKPDRCPPGGKDTLTALGNLLNLDITPYLETMQQKSKAPSIANIRENECIGCTKCIQACPVDAIIGAAKQMHSILTDECTGCELCVEPCPVDCIDIIPTSKYTYQQDKARQRFNAKQQRLVIKKQQKLSPVQTTAINNDKKILIAAAVARVKAKRAQ